MKIDDLIKKINDLENENVANRKTILTFNKKLKNIENNVVDYQETSRNLKRDTERLNSIVSKLGQFDSSLDQIRADFIQKIDEIEKLRQLQEKKRDKTHQDDRKSLEVSLLEMKGQIEQTQEKRMKTFFEEDSRLVKQVQEIKKNFDDNFHEDEETRLQIKATIEDTRRNTRKVENLNTIIESVNKKQDELNTRMELVSDQIRKFDGQINELNALEKERKQTQATFLEQQSMIQNERERTWQKWVQEFEESIKKSNAVMSELSTQQAELKRTRDGFGEITQRFDRRINELTETYRILEERLRQDWTTLKTDEQKRWANYSLVYGEKQDDFFQQYEQLKTRITAVEDGSKEIQDVLIMVSSELQKGMQGLMKMVNNWIETFDDIRIGTQPKLEK